MPCAPCTSIWLLPVDSGLPLMQDLINVPILQAPRIRASVTPEASWEMPVSPDP